MSLSVVTKATGGLPVVDVSAIAPMRGTPVSEASNGFGLAVTKVATNGMPVVYDSIGIVPPPAPTTWSTTDKSANITVSGGNLTAASTTASPGTVRAKAGLSSGKLYWELLYAASTQGGTSTGLVPPGAALPVQYTVANGGVCINGLSAIYRNGVQALGAIFGSITTGSLICVAADLNGKLIWFRVGAAGNWNAGGTANPATGVGGVDISTLTLPLVPYFTAAASGDGLTANFGATAFGGAVPAGFTSGWLA